MELCPNCDRDIQPPDAQGGRPRRWCSPGCQRSGEAKMRRANQLLRRLEKDRAWHQLHGFNSPKLAEFDAQIAEQQTRFDHLAGVPEGRLMTEDEC
jgi:hypothetical protein